MKQAYKKVVKMKSCFADGKNTKQVQRSIALSNLSEDSLHQQSATAATTIE